MAGAAELGDGVLGLPQTHGSASGLGDSLAKAGGHINRRGPCEC